MLKLHLFPRYSGKDAILGQHLFQNPSKKGRVLTHNLPGGQILDLIGPPGQLTRPHFQKTIFESFQMAHIELKLVDISCHHF